MTSIRQHLIDRHVNLTLHSPIIDEIERVATFYLYNVAGMIVGYQQYRPDASKDKNNRQDGRYYTYRTKSCVGVFGVESLYLNDRILFVTEGIFDAVRMTELGQPALAVLSNDPSTDVRNFLGCLNRTIIAVCDSGKAGQKLKKIGDRYFVLEDGDLGSATKSTVEHIISLYT